ncbi:MAG: nucleotide exchange factor GrpE [Pseudonocardiaceae bacterium]
MTGQIRVPPVEEPTGGSGAAAQGALARDAGVQGSGAPGSDAPPGSGAHSAATAGTEELEVLRSQVEERTGDLQRITAEFTNYRRRVERDRQAVTAAAKAQVARELLTVLDDIERAEAHGDLSGPFKAVADKLVAGLGSQGLESFGTAGDRFDPEVHEAVQHSTSSDVHEPTVTVVLRRGYRFAERVLRPAMVVVTEPLSTQPLSTESFAAPNETSPHVATSSTAEGSGANGHGADTSRQEH